jgi:uncharacterized protein YlxP (DUF503 family)
MSSRPTRNGRSRGADPGSGAAHVAALSLDLRLPGSHSLKEKRAVIRPILEGCRRRYQVAAAEVAHQDQWQRAGLAMAAVSASAGHATEVLDHVERFVWSFPEVEVVAAVRSWLEASP